MHPERKGLSCLPSCSRRTNGHSCWSSPGQAPRSQNLNQYNPPFLCYCFTIDLYDPQTPSHGVKPSGPAYNAVANRKQDKPRAEDRAEYSTSDVVRPYSVNLSPVLLPRRLKKPKKPRWSCSATMIGLKQHVPGCQVMLPT